MISVHRQIRDAQKNQKKRREKTPPPPPPQTLWRCPKTFLHYVLSGVPTSRSLACNITIARKRTHVTAVHGKLASASASANVPQNDEYSLCVYILCKDAARATARVFFCSSERSHTFEA